MPAERVASHRRAAIRPASIGLEKIRPHDLRGAAPLQRSRAEVVKDLNVFEGGAPNAARDSKTPSRAPSSSSSLATPDDVDKTIEAVTDVSGFT